MIMQNQVPFQVALDSLTCIIFRSQSINIIISEPIILNITSTAYSSSGTKCRVIDITHMFISSRQCP